MPIIHLYTCTMVIDSVQPTFMVLKHMYQLCNPISKIKIDKTYSDFVMPELKVTAGQCVMSGQENPFVQTDFQLPGHFNQSGAWLLNK